MSGRSQHTLSKSYPSQSECVETGRRLMIQQLRTTWRRGAPPALQLTWTRDTHTHLPQSQSADEVEPAASYPRDSPLTSSDWESIPHEVKSGEPSTAGRNMRGTFKCRQSTSHSSFLVP